MTPIQQPPWSLHFRKEFRIGPVLPQVRQRAAAALGRSRAGAQAPVVRAPPIREALPLAGGPAPGSCAAAGRPEAPQFVPHTIDITFGGARQKPVFERPSVHIPPP